MAASSRSDDAGCGRPSARRGETRVTSQQGASPLRDAPYMTRSSPSARRSSGATPGAVVHASHCWGRPALRRRPLSLEYYRSTPGQQPTSGASGAMVAKPVRHGSAAWLAKSTATGRRQGQRQAKASPPESGLHIQRQELCAFVRGDGSPPLAGMRARLGAQQSSGTRRQAVEEALTIRLVEYASWRP